MLAVFSSRLDLLLVLVLLSVLGFTFFIALAFGGANLVNRFRQHTRVSSCGLFGNFSKKPWRFTPWFLLGPLLFIVLMGGFASLRYSQHRERSTAATVRVQAATAANKLASLEAEYEHLNKPRIELDREAPATEDAPTKSESKRAKATPSEKRPDWVDTPPKRVGNVYRQVVVSDRYLTVSECYRALERYKLRKIVTERLRQVVGNHYLDADQIGLHADFIWSEVCTSEWVETVNTSLGKMKRVHILAEFTPAVDNQLQKAYRSYQRWGRVEEVGGVVIVCLAGLVLIYGLLKIDTWTRGYYTKRLFLGVPAAIMLFIALIALS